MVRLACMILVAVLAGFGAFLAGGFGDDATVLKWNQQQLEIVQNQLADLAAMLAEFKKAHGRYPTNNEGLAALEGFESRFFVLLHREGAAVGDDGRSGRVEFCERWWPMQKDAIGDFRKSHNGRAPRSADELAQTPLGRVLGRLAPDSGEAAQVELGITRSGNVLFLGESGVFSPWLVPYMYENRIGKDPNVFVPSRVRYDTFGRYTICMDKDVFVYAIAGESCAFQCDTIQRDYNRLRLMGGGLAMAGLLISLFVMCFIRKSFLPVAVFAAFALAGLGAAWMQRGKLNLSPMFYHRDPRMAPMQRATLERYHAAGILGDHMLNCSLVDLYIGPARALQPVEVEGFTASPAHAPHRTSTSRPAATTRPQDHAAGTK